MADYQRKPPAHECPPPDEPADQPWPPSEKECEEWPTSNDSPPYDPEKCPPYSGPCNCAQTPGEDQDCIQTLIVAQAKLLAEADNAKILKADLEQLLAKAKAARQDYTREKYDKLIEQWVDEDSDIVELIRKLACALPCWRCVIECHICPLINNLRDAERRLYGDGTPYTEVHSLYDLRYWHERDREAKRRVLERIKRVLAVWGEKPATTIEKILGDNAKLISDCNKSLGTDPAKVVYDVFFRLVPMHLAIAPPRGSEWTTKIGKEYTEFCACDTSESEHCCGPDVGSGEWSLRQRLIGPQPYLVDPGQYFKIICCLVEKRYNPANRVFAQANAKFQAYDDEIKYLKTQIENGLKTFSQDAKGAIPNAIDCSDYEPDDDTSQQKQTRAH